MASTSTSTKSQKAKKTISISNDGISTMERPAAGTAREEFNLDTMLENISIEIIQNDKLNKVIEFDLKGVDVPVANALRRIMIAEVPTMAIHKVYIYQNTSIIADEVLSHRLGLIPVQVDPRAFQDKKEEEEYNENNSIKFTLRVKCIRKPAYKSYSDIELLKLSPEEYLENSTVFSSDFQWVPQGDQATRFAECPIRMVHKDIIVAKLRDNQEINLEVICQKGTGKAHAKWSPVCAAFYRLMPKVTITQPIKGEHAEQLKNKCPLKVFDVQDNKAVVSNPRSCTMCKECVREEGKTADSIELGKENEHFIFSVESVGMYEPFQIVKEAFSILKQKSQTFIDILS